MTNSERRISRQRAFAPLPGEARPDWAIIADVARRLGFSGFDYAGSAQIFAEHAALSGFENNGLRDFDISAHRSIDATTYGNLTPFQWPQKTGEGPQESRFFSDGRFFTADGKARLLPVTAPELEPLQQGQLRLNTGRIRDQWHTMTRTGSAPRLMAQFGEPFCGIHPQDADNLGISSADLVTVSRGAGRTVLRARITDRQRPGEIFAPMHWSGSHARHGRVNTAVAAVVDPVSGQPALKAGMVDVRRFDARWFGYAVTAGRSFAVTLQSLDYHAVYPIAAGQAVEFASTGDAIDWEHFARTLCGDATQCAWVGLRMAGGGLRLAAFRDEALQLAVFIDAGPVEVSRSFVAAALGRSATGSARLAILAGRPRAAGQDDGPLVCACRGVGRNRIEAAIRAGSSTVEAVAAACAAGSECGSCRSEIKELIRDFEKIQTPRTARVQNVDRR